MEATKELMEAVQGGDVKRLGEILEAEPALAGARDANGTSRRFSAGWTRRGLGGDDELASRLVAATPG